MAQHHTAVVVLGVSAQAQLVGLRGFGKAALLAQPVSLGEGHGGGTRREGIGREQMNRQRRGADTNLIPRPDARPLDALSVEEGPVRRSHVLKDVAPIHLDHPGVVPGDLRARQEPPAAGPPTDRQLRATEGHGRAAGGVDQEDQGFAHRPSAPQCTERL